MNLYIHLPFCKSKCQYCDFNSYADYGEGLILNYLAALNREIRFAGAQYRKAVLSNVYIGGGTPSVLAPEKIERICSNVIESFKSDIEEFSIECNPESLDEEKLNVYKNAGINRLSLGVQSLSNDNLRSLGRIHDAEIALKKLKLAGKYFDNVSADLIIGLPYDTEEIIRGEIRALSPLVKHVSMYELSVEEDTPLKRRVDEGRVWLPDDDETADLFDAAIDEARKLGFERYEISNFAKEGYISRHNFGYWTREEYLGIGAGAHSLVKTSDGNALLKSEVRFASPKNLNAYIGGVNCADSFDCVPRAEWNVLDEKEIFNERIMLGLRTSDGIEANLIEDRISDELKKFFILKEGRYSLTEDGMSVMNAILLKIMPD